MRIYASHVRRASLFISGCAAYLPRPNPAHRNSYTALRSHLEPGVVEWNHALNVAQIDDMRTVNAQKWRVSVVASPDVMQRNLPLARIENATSASWIHGSLSTSSIKTNKSRIASLNLFHFEVRSSNPKHYASKVSVHAIDSYLTG